MAIEQTVVINTDTKSLSALKTEISQIQAQLDLTPTGTKEYDDLVVRLRQAKGEIKDFKEATKGLDPDQRAAKLVNAFQGMTGAIQAAAGAVTLFGVNSENLEKVEKNLLGIIAIGGGIQSTIEGYNDAVDVIGPKLSQLGNSIKGAFTTAAGGVNLFKVALAGIGIGIAIAAVVKLVEIFDDAEKVIKANQEALENAKVAFDNFAQSVDVSNEAISRQATLAKAQAELAGASAEEILKIEQDALNESLFNIAQKLDALNKSYEAQRKLAVAAAKKEKKDVIKAEADFNTEFLKQQAALNKQLFDGDVQFKLLEINLEKQQQAERDKLAKERRDKAKKNAQERAKNEKDALLDLAEVERQFFLEQETTDADRANREFTNTLERLREQKQQELNQLNLTEVAKQAIRDKYNKLEILAEQKNAADLARIAAEANQKQLADNLKQIEEDFATVSSLEDATGRERQRRLNEQSRTIEEALKETLTEIDDIYELSRNAINETILQTTDPQALEALNAQLLALDEKYLDDRSNAFKKAATDIINIEELKAQKIAELDDIILDGTKSLLSDLSTLNQNFAQGNEAAQKQAFEQQKAFATVSAIIDTYLAAQKAFTSQIIPGDPSSLFRAQVAAGVAIAVGLARVAVIRSQQFNNPNTGGGGGSAGGSVGGGGGGGAAGGGGGGLFGEFTGTVLPPRLAPPSGGGDRADTTGEFQQLGVTTPIVRAYVLSGDVTDAQTADIKLQQKRKL
jgi:hypothetical protein